MTCKYKIRLLYFLFLILFSLSSCTQTEQLQPSTNLDTPLSVESAIDIVKRNLPSKNSKFFVEFVRQTTVENNIYYLIHVYTLGDEKIIGDKGPFRQQFTFAWLYVDVFSGDVFVENLGVSTEQYLVPWQ